MRTGNEAQARAFFAPHGSARFEPVCDGTGDLRVTNWAGWYRDDGNGRWKWLVLPAVFKGELARGFDPKALARELVERGFLLADRDGKSSQAFRYLAPGRCASTTSRRPCSGTRSERALLPRGVRGVPSVPVAGTAFHGRISAVVTPEHRPRGEVFPARTPQVAEDTELLDLPGFRGRLRAFGNFLKAA